MIRKRTSLNRRNRAFQDILDQLLNPRAVVSLRQAIGAGLQGWQGVGDGHTQAGGAEHGRVVLGVSQPQNTTIAAVAVEATMYRATGTAAEIASLTTNFLPGQVANATANHLDPLIYACEALGLVFALSNENNRYNWKQYVD